LEVELYEAKAQQTELSQAAENEREEVMKHYNRLDREGTEEATKHIEDINVALERPYDNESE
jgi:hypothetical protein